MLRSRFKDSVFYPATDTEVDICIIGSGMGGAMFAAGLANSGLRVLMVEAGDFIPESSDNRDPRTVYQEMRFHPKTPWIDKHDRPFIPGTYEWVGGNTKFYGAVLYRFREVDFAERHYEEGVSPAWPFGYSELQPWYEKAETILKVRGQAGEDPTEPPGPYGYNFPPVPDEPAIAEVRRRLQKAGAKVCSLPLGVDIDQWMRDQQGPWDGYPDASCTGKMEAESCALPIAAADRNFKLLTNARATAIVLKPDGKTVEAVEVMHRGQSQTIKARLIVVACGAVNSAALLLRSGLANSSDQVGRNFMNHIFSALIAVDPRFRNTSQYQKTLSINDYYFDDNETGKALGNIQLLGRILGDTLRGNVRMMPSFVLNWISAHAADFFLQSEDVPRPENRVVIKDGMTKLEWYRPSIPTHLALVAQAKKMLKAAGFPLLFHRLMDESIPYHQCGTVRMGSDPGTSVLNSNNVSWDHPNLMVVDASCLVSSAAVNPALTVAALSLRAADHAKKFISQLG